MKIGDIVEFEITSDPYYRQGTIVAKRFSTCRILVKYENGRKKLMTRKEKQLKLIKENKQ